MKVFGTCSLIMISFIAGCGVKGDLVPYVDVNPVISTSMNSSQSTEKEPEKQPLPKGKTP